MHTRHPAEHHAEGASARSCWPHRKMRAQPDPENLSLGSASRMTGGTPGRATAQRVRSQPAGTGWVMLPLRQAEDQAAARTFSRAGAFLGTAFKLRLGSTVSARRCSLTTILVGLKACLTTSTATCGLASWPMKASSAT